MTKLQRFDSPPPPSAAETRDVEAIAARITELFATRLNTEVPEPDTDLFESAILDSLRFVELLALLEETFGVRVSVEELEIDAFRSVARIARFVAAKRRA